MILAIDIGNTNIVVGCIDREKTYFIERLSTVRTKTELEYAVDLKTVVDIYHVKRTDIDGCIISSVVPQITNAVKLAAEKVLKKEPMVLGPGVKTGLNIMMDNPGQLGADQVANAVAGIAEYPVPLALIDMGTATTISVVDEKKHYVGGMIFPGMGVSLDALTARASQLSGISIDAPKRIIGKNTIECMKSGVIYSNAAALDGSIDRIEAELGQKITVVATGGLAKKVVPHCRREIILDEDLLLKGLLVIYEKNRKIC
nr:type III pantothenate kinase [uncultured Blautia sp.]